MKNGLLKLSIVVVLLIIFAFPLMALFSFITLNSVEKNAEVKMVINNFKNDDGKIYNNKNGKININDIALNEEIISDDIPLGVETGNQVTGAILKSDFKSHEEEILNNEIKFEIINKSGHSIFFITYEELDLVVNDKAKYHKYFALDENRKLTNYVYVAD